MVLLGNLKEEPKSFRSDNPIGANTLCSCSFTILCYLQLGEVQALDGIRDIDDLAYLCRVLEKLVQVIPVALPGSTDYRVLGVPGCPEVIKARRASSTDIANLKTTLMVSS